MVQVVNTDRDKGLQINSKFSPVLDSFWTCFSQINHAYFQKPTSECDDYIEPTQEDIGSLTVIDSMSFKVDVQSNINEIVYFRVDITKDKDKDKMTPDKFVTEEINFTLRGTNTYILQHNTPATTNGTNNATSNVNELLEIGASLLDLSNNDKEFD